MRTLTPISAASTVLALFGRAVAFKPIGARVLVANRSSSLHRTCGVIRCRCLTAAANAGGSDETTPTPAPGFGSRSKRRTTVTKKPVAAAVAVLRRSKGWACVQGCGACCYLAPEERPDLSEYLTEEELPQYMSMVGEDGWCKNFDKEKRACTIYEERPDFCRVTQVTFNRMYGVGVEEMDRFCTECCREQITDVYGKASPEMIKFNTALKGVKSGRAPVPTDPFKGTDREDQITTWE